MTHWLERLLCNHWTQRSPRWLTKGSDFLLVLVFRHSNVSDPARWQQLLLHDRIEVCT